MHDRGRGVNFAAIKRGCWREQTRFSVVVPRVAVLSPCRPRNAFDVHPRRDAGEGLLRRPTDATGSDSAELRAGVARGVAQGAGDSGAERGAAGVAHGDASIATSASTRAS